MRVFLCLSFLIGYLAASEVDTRVLEAWLKRQPSIESLQVDFTQTRTLPALKKPITTPGKLTMAKGGKMRWELGKPPKTAAISKGEKVLLIDIEKKRARSMSADSSRAKPFTLLSDQALNGGLDQFTRIFEPTGAQTVKGIHQLTAIPRDRSMRSKLKRITFSIDPARNELRALEVWLDDKSSILTTFERPRFNEKIPAQRFEFDLSGYKVL